jgi:hypothetical protein
LGEGGLVDVFQVPRVKGVGKKMAIPGKHDYWVRREGRRVGELVSLRMRRLLLILSSFAALAPSWGQNSAAISDGSTYTKAQEDAFISELILPLSQRKRARNEPPLVEKTGAIFDDVTFEQRVWNEMMVNVRETRNIPSLLGELREIGTQLGAIDKSSADRFSKIDDLQKRKSKLRSRLELAQRAEQRLSGLILHLSNLLDARAVRLIAPFLNEEDVSSSEPGFDRSTSIPVFVQLRLSDLERARVFDSGISKANKNSIDEWRKWWSLRKADFGHVYEQRRSQQEESVGGGPRSVLASSQPIASNESPESHQATESDMPPEGKHTWYWVGSAVCIVAFAGIAAALRKKR